MTKLRTLLGMLMLSIAALAAPAPAQEPRDAPSGAAIAGEAMPSVAPPPPAEEGEAPPANSVERERGTRAPMPAPRGAEPSPVVDAVNGMVKIDFNDVDIKVFIKAMSEITGKNFVVDDKVTGKVTIISPTEVTVAEAMKVFESTLEVYGFTLLEAGGVIKVVPAAEARHRGSFTMGPREPGDRMETRLIPLNHVDAGEIVNTLRPLVPPTGYLTFYKGSNTLIVVDYASNIAKLAGIIQKLDTKGHEEIITVQRLTFAGAREMSDRLTKLFGDRGGARRAMAPAAGQPGAPGAPDGGDGFMALADERVNAVIIVSGKLKTDQALALIGALDAPAPSGQGKINVYYLKNADAEDLAKVLMNFTQQAARQGRAGAQPSPHPAQPGGSLTLQNEVTITPDKSTNSLVITASREDFETLREVIEKLDIRRRQVFVEALIMEITTDKKRQFGIEWRTTSNFTEQGVQGIGGTNYGNINAVAENPLNAPKGLALGVVDGTIAFAGKEFLNLGGLLHALQTETGINILSTPNILTTDNQEAEIVVAQNVPFLTGQSQTTGGNVLTSIERRDIGITLRIKPQISESEVVKLDVYQEISSLSEIQLAKASDLITFKRSVKSTVVVKDGQNIAIGGLIRDDFTDVENKVPLLGDIPLLGWLFKSMSKQKQKTNLLIFLTPHIINTDEQVAAITQRREEYIQRNPKSESGEFESPLQPPAPREQGN